jgi:glycerol-3-phosphate acyltransferase PlsX
MVRPVTIAIDVDGGDRGVDVSVPAALAMLKQRDELRLILVGKKELIEPSVAKLRHGADRVRIEDAREIVEMSESAADALRKKKNSSMRIAINMVKEGQASACVSAGNTGALMATARFVLKTLPGIDRPAIMAVLPTKYGRTHMLDLGANSDCTSDQLFQFAVMGSVVVNGIEDISEPRVGLLNIGAEDIKGNETVRGAANL